MFAISNWTCHAFWLVIPRNCGTGSVLSLNKILQTENERHQYKKTLRQFDDRLLVFVKVLKILSCIFRSNRIMFLFIAEMNLIDLEHMLKNKEVWLIIPNYEPPIDNVSCMFFCSPWFDSGVYRKDGKGYVS